MDNICNSIVHRLFMLNDISPLSYIFQRFTVDDSRAANLAYFRHYGCSNRLGVGWRADSELVNGI